MAEVISRGKKMTEGNRWQINREKQMVDQQRETNSRGDQQRETNGRGDQQRETNVRSTEGNKC